MKKDLSHKLIGSIASCNWKEYYAKAAALASSDNPQMVFAAAEMLHEMVSATFDRSDEFKFWKGQAAKALGDIFALGVSGPASEEDGRIVAESYLDSDLLKAQKYYRIAARYGCYDGVILIGDIYTALGDYYHASMIYAGVLRHGYAGKEDAEHILEMWLTEGRIRCIPDEDDKCESPLNGFGEYFPSLEITLVRNKAIS